MHLTAATSAATECFPERETLHSGRTGNPLLARLFGFPTVVVFCLARLILAMVPRSMADPDIWWHLRNAELFLTRGSWMRADQFSFTAPDAPWINHEWLAELPFLLGWRLAGGNGVFCVSALVIEAIFAGVLWLAWRASRSLFTATLVTVGAAFLATVSFGPRTLLFGWLCLVAELVLLELFLDRPRAVLGLPLLFALWVNLHGSWLIGLVVFGAFAVTGHLRLRFAGGPAQIGSARFSPQHTRMLGLAAVLILPALCLNPYGWRLVRYPFDFAFRQTLNVANVQEWHSLDLHSLRGRIVIAAIVLLVGRQLWRPREWSLPELALLFLGFYSAFNYSRFLFLLALLGAASVARSFRRREHVPERMEEPVGTRAMLLNAALMLTLAALIVVGFRRPHADADMKEFPVAALPALAQLHPEGRIFNEFLWGGYMEWYLHDVPVFIDSRVDLFEYNGTLKDYLDIIYIRNSLALLDRYRVQYVFFEKDTPLVYLLEHAGGWRVRYEDATTVLLERMQR